MYFLYKNMVSYSTIDQFSNLGQISVLGHFHETAARFGERKCSKLHPINLLSAYVEANCCNASSTSVTEYWPTKSGINFVSSSMNCSALLFSLSTYWVSPSPAINLDLLFTSSFDLDLCSLSDNLDFSMISTSALDLLLRCSSKFCPFASTTSFSLWCSSSILLVASFAAVSVVLLYPLISSESDWEVTDIDLWDRVSRLTEN